VTIKNRLPLALSYDSNDNPSGLAEFLVSSTDLADVATNHIPTQNQVLAFSAVGDGTFLYAPSTLTNTDPGVTKIVAGTNISISPTNGLGEVTITNTGGGGGASFPTGSTGDILYYAADGTSLTPIDPTVTPLNLATTGYVADELASYATNSNLAATGLSLINTQTALATTGAALINTQTALATTGAALINTQTALAATGAALINTQTDLAATGLSLINTQTDLAATGLSLINTQTDLAATGLSLINTQTDLAATGLSLINTQTDLAATGLSLINTQTALAATGAALATTGAALATTNTNLAATGLSLFNTQTALATTGALLATALQKPSTGAEGELLVLGDSGNNTTTTSVSDFLTGNSIVTFSNFGNQLTNNDGLTKTEAASFSSTLFASAAFTTADGRAFINSNADLSNVGKVLTTTPTDGQVLAYDGNNWAPKTIVGGFGLISPGAKLEGAELVLETSNVITTPPGTTGKGDANTNKLLAFSGTDASSTKFVGSEFGIELIQQPDQAITAGDNFIYFSADLNDGGTSGPVATSLNSNVKSFIENGSGTSVGVPQVLHRQVGAPVASSNSTSLAELVSFTLPANYLALGDIDIRIRGRQFAQGSNLRWNFKIAGTNILNSNISQGTFSDFTVYNMHIQISKTATDKQLVTANFTQSTGSSSAAGKGSWAGTHRVGQITNDGVTADESTALALSLEAQQANSAQTVTVDQFRVTLMPDPA